MLATTRNVFRTLAVASVFLVTPSRAGAQPVIVEVAYPPTVTYFQPTPAVVYESLTPVVYYAPRITYSPVRSVSYYAPPVVSHPVPPVVLYYPGTTTTTRYGLFGQPRETRSYYPTYVLPR